MEPRAPHKHQVSLSVSEVSQFKKELLAIGEKIRFLQLATFDDNQNLCIDRFQVEGLIGVGAYAKVYKAVEKKSKAHFALKVVRKVLALHRRCVSHLLREAQILSSFRCE
jgi:serine/threonine protein kinase